MLMIAASNNPASLIAAIVAQDSGKVQSLLDGGAPGTGGLGPHGASARYAAAPTGSAVIFRAHHGAGAGRNQQSAREEAPIHGAAIGGSEAICRELILLGSDINARNSSAVTPLHMAAQAGHAPVCALLVSAGAIVDAESNLGWTPLAAAVWAGQAGSAAALIAAKANVDHAVHGGATLLHIAAVSGRKSMCKLLLDAGAAKSVIDTKYGLTPFQAAVQAGCVEVIRYFVTEFGEDLKQLTGDGLSMRELASRHGKTLQLLRELEEKIVTGGANRAPVSQLPSPR
jgi:hypothetical protein